MTKSIVVMLTCVGLAHVTYAQAVVATREITPHMPASVLLNRSVTIDITRISLKRAIDVAAASAKVLVQYRTQVVDVYTTPITLHMENAPLGLVLDRILAGTPLQVVSDGTMRLSIVRGAHTLESAQGVITGVVTDANTKQQLPGVTVALDDASNGVVTGADGRFRILGVSAGQHRVTARLIGRVKLVKTVMVSDSGVTMTDFALEARAEALAQVVVTGTIIPTELKAVPNAITVITAKQIEERGITKIDQLFRGDVPGLFATNLGSAALLDEVTMFSRGATALSGSSTGVSTDPNLGISFLTNPIKTYVDGIELADPKYLSQIDPKSIERIEILTGPQASTIYGSNAINGVMQIFTKRGTTSTPQLTLNLLSGWVENNFSSARTPQHDYSVQANGIEGRMSYNAGGSWNYTGPWTPAKQMARTGGFGGARLEVPAMLGRVTADITLRRTVTQNKQRGSAGQTSTGYRGMGWWTNVSASGLSQPNTSALTSQTLGLMLAYTPANWWSHELSVGVDASDYEQRYTARGYLSISDTTLGLQQNHTDRRSLRYATTARIAITSLAQATVTAGADGWQNLTTSMTGSSQTLTGTLTGTTSMSRQPEHNTGGFLQTQLDVKDRLFFTYGLRAEWNPGYGADAQPNYAPRYGLAYTQDVGTVTVKVRGSYGRSTRPPQPKLKVAMTAAEFYGPSTWSVVFSPYYGNIDFYLANPDLTPEHQQGGEAGLELYVGTRGLLTITRYNQTVDGLIDLPKVDSARSFVPTTIAFNRDIDGYGYIYQYQYLSIGSIRNQGWELQGSMNVGPITTRGTYSWTKSRTIGVNPKYRAWFTPSDYPQYQPGATFRFLPEHTWALGVTYAHAASTVGLNITGTGRVTNAQDDFYLRNLVSNIRLSQNRQRMTDQGYVNFNGGYALADIIVSQRFLPRVEGVLQIQNLMDRYTNDYYAAYASLGRQLKAGLRVRTS